MTYTFLRGKIVLEPVKRDDINVDSQLRQMVATLRSIHVKRHAILCRHVVGFIYDSNLLYALKMYLVEMIMYVHVMSGMSTSIILT